MLRNVLNMMVQDPSKDTMGRVLEKIPSMNPFEKGLLRSLVNRNAFLKQNIFPDHGKHITPYERDIIELCIKGRCFDFPLTKALECKVMYEGSARRNPINIYLNPLTTKLFGKTGPWKKRLTPAFHALCLWEGLPFTMEDLHLSKRNTLFCKTIQKTKHKPDLINPGYSPTFRAYPYFFIDVTTRRGFDSFSDTLVTRFCNLVKDANTVVDRYIYETGDVPKEAIVLQNRTGLKDLEYLLKQVFSPYEIRKDSLIIQPPTFNF